MVTITCVIVPKIRSITSGFGRGQKIWLTKTLKSKLIKTDKFDHLNFSGKIMCMDNVYQQNSM